MKTNAPKNKVDTTTHHSNPFFSKTNEDSFFPESQQSDQPFFGTSVLQPKLKIGHPGDPYEQEADAVADQVVEKVDTSKSDNNIQAKCANCDEEEQLQKKEQEEGQPDLMRKPVFEGDDETTEETVQKKASNSSESKKTGSMPVSTIGVPTLSMRQVSNNHQEMIQRIPFEQFIPKSSNTEPKEEDGQAEPEKPLFVKSIPSKEGDDPTSNLDDPVNATISYVPSVTRGGITPKATAFGITGSSAKVINVHIDHSGSIYKVKGDLELKIKWEVLSGTGPSGQVDIQNENDPDIKSCNYQLVAKDLTPNMGSDNGRPPRSKFWAEDLTIRHEKFHAINQRKLDYGPKRLKAIQNYLNKKSASSKTEIRDTLIPQAQSEGWKVFDALSKQPSTEGDAYGDGAPLYKARADAIKAKGDVGDYGLVSVMVTVHPKGGGTHEVVRGDTLWGIAKKTYGHGKYWRNIHRANPGKARKGGDLIFPGQVFDLPQINIDQNLFVYLSQGSKMRFTDSVLVPGGTSHTFLELPNDIFEDTTNCDGNVTVEVWDGGDAGTPGLFLNRLLTTSWALPANGNAKSGNIEVNTSVGP